MNRKPDETEQMEEIDWAALIAPHPDDRPSPPPTPEEEALIEAYLNEPDIEASEEDYEESDLGDALCEELRDEAWQRCFSELSFKSQSET